MAKRRSVRSPKTGRESAAATKKRARNRPVEDVSSPSQRAIGTAYGFASFPIKENQDWSHARYDAQLSNGIWLQFADAFPGGMIAGFDVGTALNYFDLQFAAKAAEVLYLEPVVDAPSGDPLVQTERERTVEALVVRSASALQDFVGIFVDLATLAATRVAMLRGIDEAANRPLDPPIGTWWAMYRDIAPVRPITDAQRDEVVKMFADGMRDLLKRCLFGDGATLSSGGRPPEEERDHRAYCTRERLVHSPESIYARLPLHLRRQRAKRDVRTHIILRKLDDTCSESNWSRIMSSGKRIHASMAPGTPYCKQL